MRTILGEHLFEAGEVASIGTIHPATARDWCHANPGNSKWIGGRLFITAEGLKRMLSLTDAQVAMAVEQCRTGKVKSVGAAA